MNAQTLPLDWKPAAFNPNFNADEAFEDQCSALEKMVCTLNTVQDLTSAYGNEVQRATVTLRREDLSGLFRLLRDVVIDVKDRNELMHKHISNKWGWERIQAEQELQSKS